MLRLLWRQTLAPRPTVASCCAAVVLLCITVLSARERENRKACATFLPPTPRESLKHFNNVFSSAGGLQHRFWILHSQPGWNYYDSLKAIVNSKGLKL